MKRHNVAEIFKKYRRQLFSFIRYRTSEDEAEDILQDVFLRFIQADNVSPINQVSSWLFQTARNKIIDNGRKCKEGRCSRSSKSSGNHGSQKNFRADSDVPSASDTEMFC